MSFPPTTPHSAAGGPSGEGQIQTPFNTPDPEEYSYTHPVSNHQEALEKLPHETLVLVLGIISVSCALFLLVTFGVGSLVAVILGIMTIKKASMPRKMMRANQELYEAASQSKVKAGYVCGVVGMFLGIAGILLWVAVLVFYTFAFGVLAAAMNGAAL